VKRFIIASLVSCLSLWGQSSASATSSVDINGKRVYDGAATLQSKSGNQTVTTQTVQSINGGSVPVEQVTERVIRDDASGRVVERTIQRFDANGRPTPPVKETIEAQKRPDGSSTTQTATYRQDINGHMQLAEKSVTDVRKSGSQETTETSIQRPTINGSVETVEKQSAITVKDASGNYKQETTSYRKNAAGSFYAATRQTVDHTEQGTQSKDNAAQYEIGPTGQMELHSQTVSTTTTEADGSKSTVTNVYGTKVPGTVNTSSSLALQEQQIIDRRKGPNDTVVETVNLRRPSISDPKALGPARPLSQTVCQGNCKP
jgi:hypothetical protein